MDTSSLYIRMCGDADSIQKLWKPSDGDYYYLMSNNNLHTSIRTTSTSKPCCIWRGGEYKKKPPFDLHLYGLIWLPRQDQLLKLIFSKPHNNFESGNKKHNFISKMLSILNFFQANKNVSSIEQLLLKFIMKDKHNKTWSGNSWISYTPILFKYNKMFKKVLKKGKAL